MHRFSPKPKDDFSFHPGRFQPAEAPSQPDISQPAALFSSVIVNLSNLRNSKCLQNFDDCSKAHTDPSFELFGAFIVLDWHLILEFCETRNNRAEHYMNRALKMVKRVQYQIGAKFKTSKPKNSSLKCSSKTE